VTQAPEVKLGDIAGFIRGINFKPDDVVPLGTEGTVGCMRTKNVQDELDCSDVWAVPKEFVRRNEQMLAEGDILVSSANSWNLVGKCSWIPRLEYPSSFGGFVSVLRANPEKVEPRFLYRWFSWDRTQALLRSFGQKTTNISNLNIERCLNIKLSLPSLFEQRRIAAILNQADALRAKRREALAQLESLTQSIFIEMFGDPVANPKGWQPATLGDLIHSASDGPHVSPIYAECGVPFLSARHVRPGEISWHDLKYLTREDAEIQWKKCKPSRGDILYTKGGTTGFAAVVRTDDKFAVWVHVALLKPNRQLVDSTWLEAMLNTQYCYRQSQDLTHGIANRDLGLKRMVKILMYHPPLALQREFAHRMTQVAQQIQLQQNGLAEFDNLFASVQHRAFRGEL
jgi:type I restriction enzyme, S subunit